MPSATTHSQSNDSQVELKWYHYSNQTPLPGNNSQNISVPLHGKYISLMEGFCVAPTKKQPGGTTNTRTLPLQTICVNFSVLPYPVTKLAVELCGANGATVNRICSQLVYMQPDVSSVQISFSNLIITESSHNWGKKLRLKFGLYDTLTESCVDSVLSAPFETITHRGIQKQQKRQQEKLAKRQTKTYKFHIGAYPSK